MSVGDDPGIESAFPGNGEMAARMREFDWPASPLGEPASWPASLKTAVRICLASRFPMIIWWGPDLRFLYNDAYLPLLGTKHPALDRPGAQVWPEIWHIIGPMLRGVLETGQATWSEDLLLPMNRHGYWEETYWTYSYSPLYGDDGAMQAVFTAVSDTTERVIGGRRLAGLRELGAQADVARTIDEAAQLVTEVLGRAGSDVPFAALYLLRPGTGETRLAAATSGDEPLPLPGGPGGWPLAEVLADGAGRVVSDVAARFGDLPSGGWTTSPTEAMVLPLAGETGTTSGVLVLAASAGRALDEPYRTYFGLVARQTAALLNGATAYQAQQQRAEELAALDAAKTVFFANISHEFRTPLTLIMGPAATLREALADGDERLREEVEVIHRNSLRLGRLVTTLLDFSRIEAGRMQARFEPVDLAAFTTELASVFRSATEKAGLRLDVDCPAQAEPVHVDRGMWEKVILNLLSNAVKYTFDGGILVSVRQDDRHAVVTVADTGIGIERAELPHLFERFHRIPSARARSNEGSGIGLALVRELVTLHGGVITAESTPGTGTTFTLRLPLGTGHLPADQVVTDARPGGVEPSAVDPFLQETLRWLPEDEPTPSATVPRSSEKGSAAKVLVADDNADMRDYLGRLLRDEYEVTAVADGAEALALAAADPPDLVISDVMMPRLDGLELLSALRGDPRTAGIPVLLLSARAGQEAAVDGLAAGADDYLTKPFTARELLARARSTVGLARLRLQHARWRTALIESLQEGFVVADETGAVVEMNTAFADLLGYGPEGLPYPAPQPWWPDAGSEPDAHAEVARAFEQAMTEPSASFVVPLRHREGHRVWVTATYNALHDDEGRRRIVATVRDVTAERYAVQRETVLATMNQRLAGISGVRPAVRAAVDVIGGLWQARRVLAVTWRPAGEPEVISNEGGSRWTDLPEPLRARLDHLRLLPALHTDSGTDGTGVRLDHPDGRLVLWLEPGSGHALGHEDATVLALLAGTVGAALRRAHRDDRQREVAIALQRSILGPAELPRDFAVRYEPADPPLEVGGDWYDVITLADGRIGIVVGDCVGRGLGAAAVMGQLRSACRALLLEAHSPSDTLSALDRFAERLPGAACTTVFCGVLDPATGRLRYSSAGHPPAVLLLPHAEESLLDQGQGLPLTISSGDARPDATAMLPIGSLLVVYSDGLVERRREPLDEGIARAGATARAASPQPLPALASTLMETLRPSAGYEDDVALLLYRRSVPPMNFSFPAVLGSLASMRSWLRAWLANSGLDADLAQDVLVAAGEACANSVEHAYPIGQAGTVELKATLLNQHLVLVVTDHGRWKPSAQPPDPLRGRGIPMMEALSDSSSVIRGHGGTTVTLEWAVAS